MTIILDNYPRLSKSILENSYETRKNKENNKEKNNSNNNNKNNNKNNQNNPMKTATTTSFNFESDFETKNNQDGLRADSDTKSFVVNDIRKITCMSTNQNKCFYFRVYFTWHLNILVVL